MKVAIVFAIGFAMGFFPVICLACMFTSAVVKTV